MNFIVFQSINNHGELFSGKWLGDESNLRIFLKKQNFKLIKIKHKKNHFLRIRKKISSFMMVQFCFQLIHLIKGGINITKSIQLISEQKTFGNLHCYLKNINFLLENGYTLSEAFKSLDAFFPNLFLYRLSIAEHTGETLFFLEKLHSYFLWQHETLGKVKQIIRYPIILSIIIAMFFMIISQILIPNILSFIQISELSGKNNVFLNSLLFISSQKKYLLLIISLFILLIPILFFIHQKFYFDNRNVLNKILFFRFYYFYKTGLLFKNLSILLQSGIDVNRALEILIKDFPKNKLLKKIYDDLAEGCIFSQAIEKYSIFKNTTLGMIKLAEKSGNLGPILETISDLYIQIFKQKLERFIFWTQPFLIVTIGCILVWIILAVFWPLYENIAEIKI